MMGKFFGLIMALALTSPAFGADYRPSATNVTSITSSTGSITTCLRVPVAGTDLISGPCVGGNTGLGTSSPSSRLDVGAQTITASTIAAANVGGLFLHDDGGNGIFVEDGGNVGVGLTNPGREFEVSGDIEGNAFIASDATPDLKMEDTTAGDDDWRWRADADHSCFEQKVGDATWTNVLFMEGGGNVGIGTSEPTYKLSIADVNSPRITWADTTTPTTGFAMATNDTVIMGALSNHPLRLDTNSSSRLYIKADGSVGIGTTAPGNLLEVASATGADSVLEINTTDADDATSDAQLLLSEAGTAKWHISNDGSKTDLFVISSDGGLGTEDRLVIEQGGSIGIGTTNPRVKLEVAGSNIWVSDAYGFCWDNCEAMISADGQGADSDWMKFNLDAETQLWLDGAGNVSMGDAYDPDMPLRVHTSSLTVKNDGGTGAWVGVNTAAPTDALTVSGGGILPYVRTKAQFDGITPAADQLGAIYICSDCTVPYAVCVATGNTLSGFRQTIAADTTTGCGSDE